MYTPPGQGVARKEDEIPCVPRKSAETKQNEEKILSSTTNADQFLLCCHEEHPHLCISINTSLSPLHFNFYSIRTCKIFVN
jgi:hypothetical protein